MATTKTRQAKSTDGKTKVKTQKTTETETGGISERATRIEIPAMQLGLLKVHIKGLSPYISNKKPPGIKTGVKETEMDPRDMPPEEQAYRGLYVLDKNVYGIPCSGFKKSALTAVGVTKLKRFIISQAFHILGDFVPIEKSKPKLRKDIVRIRKTGGSIERFRYEFPNWEVSLTIRYNKSVINPEQIIRLLNMAGFGVGIGDWRPEKGGSFGQFEVV